MAEDLRPHGIACVAVSPGFMRLERMNLNSEEAAMTESAEFPGRAIAALAADDNILAKTGLVFTTPALAKEYGFTDLDGSQHSPFWESHWSGAETYRTEGWRAAGGSLYGGLLWRRPHGAAAPPAGPGEGADTTSRLPG